MQQSSSIAPQYKQQARQNNIQRAKFTKTVARPTARKRLPCLYTKHLTKKRKTWSDGFVTLSFDGGQASCTLYSDTGSDKG